MVEQAEEQRTTLRRSALRSQRGMVGLSLPWRLRSGRIKEKPLAEVGSARGESGAFAWVAPPWWWEERTVDARCVS
jgi:hypothetical protein